MGNVLQKLKIFSFIYYIFFLPEISFSQSIDIEKSSFKGKNYNVSIPSGYCNISKTRAGIFMFNHLLEVQKNSKTLLPEAKFIFAKCDYDINNLYPWGYIGFLNNDNNFSQSDINNALSSIFDNSNIMKNLSDITKRAIDKTGNDLYGKNLSVKTLKKPQILFKDKSVITFQAINSGILDGESITEITVGSGTVFKNVMINTYITNEIEKEPNSYTIAGELIKHNKMLRSIN